MVPCIIARDSFTSANMKYAVYNRQRDGAVRYGIYSMYNMCSRYSVYDMSSM